MVTVMEPPKMQKQLVDYRTEDGVAIVELNDPPANAYSLEMMRQLDEAVVRARFDDRIHVIVLRGHGERFFSAGANIRMMQRSSPRFLYNFSLYANEALNRLEHTPKLTIAALNGHTVGGGLEMALACDLRVAKANGGKIGLPEVNLGVLPGLGGTQRLGKAIGKYRAFAQMRRGETSSFGRAGGLALVIELSPAESFW